MVINDSDKIFLLEVITTLGPLLFINVIFIVVIILVVKLLKWFFSSSNKSSSNISKGLKGEIQVRRALNKLNKRYVILNDILLRSSLAPSKTTQIDHIVVSPYGIFVIETKNFGGLIIGDSEDYKWIQVTSNWRGTFNSPIMQNRLHIDSVTKLIPGAGINNIYSIIAFSSRASLKNIDITSPREIATYYHDIVRVIKTRKIEVFSKQEVNELSSTLRNSNLLDEETKKYLYS